MRIVNIITQMEAGGAQGAAVRMTESLRARGHDAETWFLYQKRPVFAESAHLRVLSPTRPSGPLDVLRLLRRLYVELRRVQPDAVIAYTHYACALALPIAWLARVPRRIATQRSVESSHPLLARVLNRWLGMSRCVHATIAVSRTVRESFGHYPATYRRKMTVVLNGIAAHGCTASREEARAALGLPPDRPLVLAVGRLAAVKNHAVLLRALKRLPGWHLAIAGDGELRDSLAALAHELDVSDRVTWLGEVPADTVRLAHRAADVFAFPSMHEAFGFAALEAAASGLPIVCSDIPAMHEVFGDAATYCASDDDAAFAEAIERVGGDPDVARQRGADAHRVAQRYTLEAMADGYERILTHIR